MINSIPVVAKAPILVLIMGNGLEPKITIAAIVCFFPTLVNMVRGLQAVNPQAMELMQILSASKREIFFKLRLYASLPYLFSALRIAASMSVIGAVVGEWIGATQGIGAMIIQATYSFDSALLYTAIIMSAVLSGLFFLVIAALERWLVKWQPEGAALNDERHNPFQTGDEMNMISDWIQEKRARCARGGKGKRGGGRRRSRRTVGGDRRGAQRRGSDPARTLQPPGRPCIGRHGAGARRHVGQPPAGNLGAGHLHDLHRADGGAQARDVPALARMGRGSRVVPQWGRWGTFDFHSQKTPHPVCFAAAFDPDGMKRVALELVESLGIKLRLHSWFSRTLVEDGQVKGVICETKSGREAILADVVIDATGDLDVAASAGVPTLAAPISRRPYSGSAASIPTQPSVSKPKSRRRSPRWTARSSAFSAARGATGGSRRR